MNRTYHGKITGQKIAEFLMWWFFVMLTATATGIWFKIFVMGWVLAK
jgi:hypothetical protein